MDNERGLAGLKIDGQFHAIYNSSPLEAGPLNKGRVKGHVVSCPWHDLAFDVQNGQGTDRGGYCVGSYDVRVEDGQVFVGGRRKV